MEDPNDLGPVSPAELALNFEAQVLRMWRTNDGMRITLLVHPQESCNTALFQLPIKGRLYVSALPIDDNEEPAPTENLLAGIRAVRRAGMIAREESFWDFAKERHYVPGDAATPEDREEECKFFIRSWCRVRSRSDIKFDSAAQVRLDELINDYSAYRRRRFAVEELAL